MTSRYRHRRTPLASTPFPSPVEPGEIVVNTANRQLAVGDASAGSLGVPKQLIAVRFFDTTAAYVLNDLVVQAGKVYRANGSIPPGAFNATDWTDLGGSATAALVTFAPGGNVSSTNVQAAIAELDVEKVAKAGDTMTGHLTLPSGPAAAQAVRKDYVDAADTTLQTNINAKTDKTYVDNADALKADKTYVDTQDALKVAKAGDTMTGDLTINKANPTINLRKAASGEQVMLFSYKGAAARWAIVLGDNAAESGGNAGADFGLVAFDDAGGYLSTPISIPRATGLLTLKADPVSALNAATKQYVDGKAPVAATAAEYLANSAPTKMLTPGAVWGAVSTKGTYSGASLTLDFGAFLDFFINPNVGSTLNNPTNFKTGQRGIIYVQQSGAGTATITTWGSMWKFPGGVKPVLSTTPLIVDAISYVVMDGGQIFCTFSAGFA